MNGGDSPEVAVCATLADTATHSDRYRLADGIDVLRHRTAASVIARFAPGLDPFETALVADVCSIQRVHLVTIPASLTELWTDLRSLGARVRRDYPPCVDAIEPPRNEHSSTTSVVADVRSGHELRVLEVWAIICPVAGAHASHGHADADSETRVVMEVRGTLDRLANVVELLADSDGVTVRGAGHDQQAGQTFVSLQQSSGHDAFDRHLELRTAGAPTATWRRRLDAA